MKPTQLKRYLLGLLLACLLTSGCARTVTVIVDPDACRQAVKVHLVGINETDMDRFDWNDLGISDYWNPDSKLRKMADTYTFPIPYEQPLCRFTLAKHDPIFKIWKERKIKHLFVIADLPGVFTDPERRLQLLSPTSKKWGSSVKDIQIAIHKDSVEQLTFPK